MWLILVKYFISYTVNGTLGIDMFRFSSIIASLLSVYAGTSSGEYTGKKGGGAPHGVYMGKKGKGHGYNETSSLGWVVNDCAAELGRGSSSPSKFNECLTWSTGIEHETLVVHGDDDQVGEYVVNVGTLALQMARYGRAFGLDHDTHSVAVYLQNTGVEFSGRGCAGINEINFKAMAESVSITHDNLNFDAAFCQVETLDSKILEVIAASPGEVAMSKEFGSIRHPRSGMSSSLGLYTRTSGKTHHCSPCDGCHLKDYTGSYHISISLPHDSEGWVAYDEKILSKAGSCSRRYGGHSKASYGESPLSTWTTAHSNLANMIQWVEPLVLAVFGSPDSDSVCDNGKFVEGSYRTMNSGWGVPGTTDVRTFGETGTGRYSKKGFDWMIDVAPKSSLGVLGCVEQGMGSDIRTKSSLGDHDTSDREKTSLMEVGYGIELRFLDNFPLEHLKGVYRLVALLAEASRTHTAESFIYGDEGWEYSAQQSILEGWNAILVPDYISSLESALDIKLDDLDGNVQAFDVLNEVYQQLSLKHADGFWTGLLLHDTEMEPLGNPNREGWELGASLAGITPDFIREAFGVTKSSSESVEIANLSGGKCFDDVEELVYLAESLGMVDSIESNRDGSVKAVRFLIEPEVVSSKVLVCHV